jgi:hypothetical protein
VIRVVHKVEKYQAKQSNRSKTVLNKTKLAARQRIDDALSIISSGSNSQRNEDEPLEIKLPVRKRRSQLAMLGDAEGSSTTLSGKRARTVQEGDCVYDTTFHSSIDPYL